MLEKWLQVMSTHWRISKTDNIPKELMNEITSFPGLQAKRIFDEFNE